jgi:hypothetical protein
VIWVPQLQRKDVEHAFKRKITPVLEGLHTSTRSRNINEDRT